VASQLESALWALTLFDMGTIRQQDGAVDGVTAFADQHIRRSHVHACSANPSGRRCRGSGRSISRCRRPSLIALCIQQVKIVWAGFFLREAPDESVSVLVLPGWLLGKSRGGRSCQTHAAARSTAAAERDRFTSIETSLGGDLTPPEVTARLLSRVRQLGTLSPSQHRRSGRLAARLVAPIQMG
jgi:hypothetical protein